VSAPSPPTPPRVVRAGVDGVELHAANGHLLRGRLVAVSRIRHAVLVALVLAGFGPAQAAAAPPTTGYVDVSVATVWTDPMSPRPVDAMALTDPVDSRSRAPDCSGFTSTIYQTNGITIPRDSGPQAGDPAARKVARSGRQPGDLLFYARDKGKGSMHNVAMYVGDGRMIEAYDHLTPVRITPARFDSEYWGAVRYL